jgi:hypothetical protein
MRAKVILPVAVLALLILLPAAYFHFRPETPAAPVSEAPAATSQDVAQAAPIPKILRRATPDHVEQGLPTHSVAPDGSQEDHQTYVLERKAQLAEMGMSDDPANLKAILGEMENPEPEIRGAALQAAVQFGSKDAIPTLQNELNWATDPEEKVEIQKAINFLQLPSFGSSGDVTQADSSPATQN